MKDNWNRFVPGPVQGVVAQRFRDAAAITALSCAHANVVRDVFAQEATVLYSGFDRAAPSPADGEVNQTPVLTLTGDLVDAEARRVLADGVKAWLAKTHGGIVLRYFGRDQDGLSELQRLLDERCLVENAGYKPVPELLRAFKDADANVYFHNPRVLFHHKVFELLSAAKPIICIPDESGEVKAIVKEIGGRLYTCSDGESIDKALGDVVARQSVPLSIHGDELAHYAWDSQSAILEKVFLDVARKEEGA